MKDQKPEFTQEQQEEIIFLLSCLVNTAHNIIEDAIEGRPISANRLENYYGSWHSILRVIDEEGSLIGQDIADSLSERWPSSANEEPKSH